MEQPTVLLAEDNPADVFLVREALLAHNLIVNLRVFADGAAAIQFIETWEEDETVTCPALALLDLNLPKKSGLEILARLRESTTWRGMPIVMISSSRNSAGTGEKTSSTADYYFNKPSNYDRYMELGGIVSRLMQNVGLSGSSAQS